MKKEQSFLRKYRKGALALVCFLMMGAGTMSAQSLTDPATSKQATEFLDNSEASANLMSIYQNLNTELQAAEYGSQEYKVLYARASAYKGIISDLNQGGNPRQVITNRINELGNRLSGKDYQATIRADRDAILGATRG